MPAVYIEGKLSFFFQSQEILVLFLNFFNYKKAYLKYYIIQEETTEIKANTMNFTQTCSLLWKMVIQHWT